MAENPTSLPGFNKALAEALCDFEVPFRVQLSPNGERVVYLTQPDPQRGENETSTMWLASATEAGSSRQLTSGLFNEFKPAWHPDGNQIAFTSDRANPGKDAAIYTMRLDGGEPIAITSTENTQTIDMFEFSPCGKTIAYISPDEKSEEDEKEPKPNVWGEDWEYARLRIVHVESKETKTLVEGSRHITDISWSPDGKSIVFLSNENPDIQETMMTGTTISTVDVETGKIRDLCTIICELTNLTWGPDGKVYFISSTPDNTELGGMAVYTIDPEAASPKSVKVAHGEVDDADSLRAAGGKIFVNREDRLIDVISELGGKDLINRGREFNSWDIHVPESGSPIVAAAFSDVNTPKEVYILREGQDDIKLSDHGKALREWSFGTCTTFTCDSADGEVELDGLYLTPTTKAASDGMPTEPLPTFVLIHGGPRSRNSNMFDTSPFYWAPYVLANGYGVLYPQYRGSSGRGEKFAAYSKGGQGKYDYADVITITDNAIKKGFADPKKLIVGGWSQGGLLTYLCSVRNGLHNLGWRFNAGIAGAGVCDIESLALTADLGSTFEVELNGGHTTWTLSRDDTRNRQGSALWEVADAVKESRIRGEPVIPPMLILHGDKDDRCPFSQAEGFRRALRAHKLPCEFVAYPGEGHGFGPRRFWLDLLERVGRWCDMYIGQGTETQLPIR